MRNAEAGMIAWEPFWNWLAAHDVVETRLIEIGQEDGNSFHIPTRPSLAFHGNLQFAIKEAKTLIEAGVAHCFFRAHGG